MSKIICPICGSQKYKCKEYAEDCWGAMLIVERHNYCDRCGYCEEQAYSEVLTFFADINRGYKGYNGKYYSKNMRKHKRYRRRKNFIGIPINPYYAYYL